VSPILGIWASAQQSAFVIGDYESIATTTVGAGGASSVTFSSIPSTYQHLQIRAIGSTSIDVADSRYTFNGDTGNNYAWHLLVGNGSTAGAFQSTSLNHLRGAPYLLKATNVFGVGVTDILDYANTNKNKTVRTLTGAEDNNATPTYAQVQFYSGLWMSTAAISSITITCSSGNYPQYSSFALYGIKG
jgi:hypothetical protein